MNKTRPRYFLTPPVLLICTAPILPAGIFWVTGDVEDSIITLGVGWMMAFPLGILWFMACSGAVAIYGRNRMGELSWARALMVGALSGFLLGTTLGVGLRVLWPFWSAFPTVWSALYMGAVLLYVGLLGSTYCMLDPYFRSQCHNDAHRPT